MADNPQTLTAVANALAQTFPNKVRRQVNRMSTFLALATIVKGGGKNVPWDVEGLGAVAENHAEGAAVANYGSDGVAPAVLSWAEYRSNFRVTNTAAAAAASSASPSDLNDLIGRNLFNGAATLASLINAGAFSGAGTGTLLAGLATAISDTTTYAGLDVATYPYWKSYLIDPGALTAVSFKQIRTDLATIFTNSGHRPDVAFVTPSVLTQIKGMYDANRQWMSEVRTPGRGIVTLENAGSVVLVDGCQFIEDKDATANAITYCNLAEMEVEVLPQAVNFADPLGAADDGFNRLMLGFHAFELGRTGSDRKMSIEAKLQLKVMRRNAFGVRLNVAN